MMHNPISRRELLQYTGCGFGSVALAGMLAPGEALANAFDEAAPLAARKPPFRPRAKRVIHLMMNGGPSQVDMFDPKPALAKMEGKGLPGVKKNDRRLGGTLAASPFGFKKHGDAAIDMCDQFRHLPDVADELCIVRSMVTDVPNHEPGLLMMNCGDFARPRPSLGWWTLYGLGAENQSLPGFVVLCPNGLPTAGTANWRSSFLPGIFQGTRVDTRETRPEELIANLDNSYVLPTQQRHQLSYVRRLNAFHQKRFGSDPALEARIQSLELAFRMQTQATDAFDLEREPKHVRELYGDTLHGRQLLMARRLLERGVRFVQVYHGPGQPWDSHANITGGVPRLINQMDQPVTALLKDLKQRGMLEDTLVIWGGEMGRTPTVQLPKTKNWGRDHQADGFTIWMAGGGVKGGHVHGETGELGLGVVDGKVHVHDLHATILHLLGFDHEQLTYRYAGRDFRLTDVHGQVVDDIIA
jgi:hypothetical protein